MAGYRVPEYAHGIVNTVLAAQDLLPNNPTYEQEKSKFDMLDNLSDGVYLIDQWHPIGQDGNYQCTHIYLATVCNGEFQAFSFAFGLYGDSSTVGDPDTKEYPVGPHLCHKGILRSQMDSSGRQFRAARIA